MDGISPHAEKQLDTILSKIEAISCDVSEIKTAQTVTNMRLGQIAEKTDRHDEILRGRNGNIGLVAIVNELSEKVNKDHLILHGNGKRGLIDEVESSKGVRGNITRFIWIALGAGVGTLLSIGLHNVFTVQ